MREKEMTVKSWLVEGDPLQPRGTDIIVQSAHLELDDKPPGEHWRIMTGNNTFNDWMRVVYRYEIEEVETDD